MNAVLQPAIASAPPAQAWADDRAAPLHPRADAPPRLLLLGTGTVGRAFVERHARLATQVPLPPLGLIANSRAAGACRGDAGAVLSTLVAAPPREREAVLGDEAFAPGDIVVDATASDAVAGHHARWLRRGVHVVTANKLGAGAGLARARDLAQAARAGDARYGDAATVGAGLPLIRSIRELARGGDRIHAVEGVLSGSLAWLFHRYDGTRPFSACVREARAAGYTEPDPRIDLSGEDVRRKLLILARAAGLPLEADAVRVDSLVPRPLAGAAPDAVDARLPELDDDLLARLRDARARGAVLRFVGRFGADADGVVSAEVGLRALPPDHPLCGGNGTDNRVAIASDRYREQPLVIQGPGAGAEVTAAALLDDVLAIARPQRPA